MKNFKDLRQKVEAKDGDGANIVKDREFKGKPSKTIPYAKPGEPGHNTHDSMFKKDGPKPAWMARKEKMKKEAVEEKKLTPAELKKREEIAKAMERDNPGMDMKKKMAIATATAKRVAEEQIDEISLSHLSNTIAKSTGTKNIKTAMKPGEVKKGLDDLKKRLATLGDPKLAKEAYRVHAVSKDGEKMKSGLHPTKKAASDMHYKMAKSGMYKKIEVVKEQADSSMCCKHCGDEFGKPTNEKCMYDAYDPKGKNWIKKESYNEAKEDDEPASPDEASMALKQLEFIEYAAEEMMDHIKSGKAFPEWFQNKLAKAHGEIEGLHSAMGEHGGDEKEMDEAVRKGAPKMQGDFLKKERERNRAHDAAMGRTPTGRKKPVRTMTSTQRSLAKLRNEETQLDEISKKTLGSYVKKASANIARTSADNARDYATGNRPVGINKKGVKIMKRTKYLNKAVDKMTQEGVQSADKKPEKYIKPDGKVGIRMVRTDKKVVDRDA